MNPLIEFGSVVGELPPCPIRPHWILEGDPVARLKVLSRSADGSASTIAWDCTAGRFNWHYQFDETVCVVEGSVLIKQAGAPPRLLTVGDTAYFPLGSSAEWTVEGYVRKVAFVRVPVYLPMSFVNRALRSLTRRIANRGDKSTNGF